MSDQKQLPLDCQQSKMTLKALRAEAKKTGVKNYSKLSRDFLIEAIEKQAEQNNISEAVKIVFDTTAPEAQAPAPAPKKKGPNKWQLHVQAFRSEHPELSYKQAMIDAKTTYQA